MSFSRTSTYWAGYCVDRLDAVVVNVQELLHLGQMVADETSFHADHGGCYVDVAVVGYQVGAAWNAWVTYGSGNIARSTWFCIRAWYLTGMALISVLVSLPVMLFSVRMLSRTYSVTVAEDVATVIFCGRADLRDIFSGEATSPNIRACGLV